jgi:sugar porter (SP) family MFS transporter
VFCRYIRSFNNLHSLTCKSGAWLSEPINGRFGRRGAIFTASLICLIANIASALSRSWQALLAFRFLLGAGLGINTSTISILAAECAPPYIRGGLAVSWQMFTAFGIFLGFVANVAVYNLNSPWRLQLFFPFIPTLPLVGLVFLCPESPAWLMGNGRYDLAFLALRRVRNTDLQAAREVYSTYIQNQDCPKIGCGTTYARKLIELFTIPRIRRATVASYTVMLSQQLCGINIIAFYSSSIFSDAGFSTFGALLASTIFGFINFIGAFPAVWTMDTMGRRSLLLLTLPLMAVTMFAAALSFSIPKESPAHFGLLAVMIYLFCAEYSPGMGPVPVAYSAEIFPILHRDVGMSFAVSVANIWASVLSLTFPTILLALKPRGTFSLYAVLNVLAFVLVFLFVPETKMKTLDELDEVFSVPSRRFVTHQTLEYLPRWILQYLSRQKEADLRDLGAALEYEPVDQDTENLAET